MILWCAIPFPKYPLEKNPGVAIPAQTTRTDYDGDSVLWKIFSAFENVFDLEVIREVISSFLNRLAESLPRLSRPDEGNDAVPGHGEAVVRINFWFFLMVYYAFYNLIALLWITKLFNLYSMNWYFPFALPRLRLFQLTCSKTGGHHALDSGQHSHCSTSSRC